MPWNSIDRITEGSVVLLASVGNGDWRLKVVGPGRCIDNIYLNYAVPVDQMTWVLYTYGSGYTKPFIQGGMQ